MSQSLLQFLNLRQSRAATRHPRSAPKTMESERQQQRQTAAAVALLYQTNTISSPSTLISILSQSVIILVSSSMSSSPTSSEVMSMPSLPELMYGVAEEMNPTKRSTMEDAYMIQPDLVTIVDKNGITKKYSLLAVYDGHGGREICDYLHATLHHVVKQELSVDDDDSSMKEKLERSFLLTDICSHVKAGIETSGATVALCLLEYELNEEQSRFVCTAIHSANAGDARITYGSCAGRAKRLTHDHRADDTDEVKRIEQAGGFVLKGRVLGVLAVARSLGDYGLKKFVIAKPFVSYTQRDWEEDESDFLIIACDGLWDVLQDQEAVNLVWNWKAQGMDKDEIAHKLCKEALIRGSFDNITVIVTWP